MSYKGSIEIVEGTYGKDVNLQAQDANGNAEDLTGCTVQWCIYEAGSTKYVLLVTCTAVDLTQGKVKYTLQAADWDTEKLQGGKEYSSVLIATKAGYREEFRDLKVTTVTKAPTEPKH